MTEYELVKLGKVRDALVQVFPTPGRRFLRPAIINGYRILTCESVRLLCTL